MRPVNRNRNTRTYTDYRAARNDLSTSIGWYCSYCEMPVKNMIEIEHVIPVNRGGKEISWHNFLLSCKYCNTVKSNHNASRSGYLWPDTDNTFLAFHYQYGTAITYHSKLKSNAILKNMAISTIRLFGLDREPSTNPPPTPADTRWISRNDVWNIAYESLTDLKESPSSVALKRQIAKTAAATGHFSIWMEVFKYEPSMRQLFIENFTGTHQRSFDKQGNPQPRQQGQL